MGTLAQFAVIGAMLGAMLGAILSVRRSGHAADEEKIPGDWGGGPL